MPRPQKKRSVCHPPLFDRFKPTGVRGNVLTEIALTLDEFEAIRLADYQGLDHNESAAEMGISRSTFSRLVEKSRRKVSQFLIEGKHLRIDGGEVHFERNLIRCEDCDHLVNIALDADTKQCPGCGSSKLINLAGGFGHGRCCAKHHRTRKG